MWCYCLCLGLIRVFVFVFTLNSPRLVTLVVRVAQVVEVHLELNTDGNIVPSESEYVPVQAVAVGSGRISDIGKKVKFDTMSLTDNSDDLIGYP